MPKELKEILKRTCADCGRKISVRLYKDRTYRGGHYFGEVPLVKKQELRKALKAGEREVRIHGLVFHVLKKDPKPYKYVEYWECPRCYWRYKPLKHK